MQEGKLIFPELSYKLRGIFYKTHNELGKFRNEKQYCDFLEKEFRDAGLSYKRELVLGCSFDGERPGRNKIDFIVDDKIIIEVKVVPSFTRENYKQAKRYLVSGGKQLCLLVNFGTDFCIIRRVLNPNNEARIIRRSG